MDNNTIEQRILELKAGLNDAREQKMQLQEILERTERNISATIGAIQELQKLLPEKETGEKPTTSP